MDQRVVRHEGHEHHGDDPGHDGDDHREGLVDLLKEAFGRSHAHSHDTSGKIDSAMASSNRGIWAVKISLLGLGITAIVQAAIFLASGSTALLADTIHNVGDAATSIPLWIAFALERRARSRRYTYGFGRTEDIAGVVIVLIIFISAAIAGYESVMKLIHGETMRHVWWVAAAAIVGFIGNELVAIFRIHVGREISSAALIADGQHSLVDGFTSLAVLVGAAGTALGAPILDPLIGLGITIAILFIVKDAGAAVFRRLLDGIEEDVLVEIERTPLEVDGVREVHEVRARWLGHQVHADLHITVDPNISVTQSHAIVEQVIEELAEHVPSFGGAIIQVCPANEDDVALAAG